MTSLASLLQQCSAHVFVPSAILLGGLHGLEPGHQDHDGRFIVAIRGTVFQSVLAKL
ncbi:MAG TPA: hypothetical protein VFU48_16170 [Nitrospira sp.]|jgi:ABC-type nickel/cobalt efflux system permease component RcnA|nr:hypothetical protein [Nitrospira sp.]